MRMSSRKDSGTSTLKTGQGCGTGNRRNSSPKSDDDGFSFFTFMKGLVISPRR
jgi:hypothetical protein